MDIDDKTLRKYFPGSKGVYLQKLQRVSSIIMCVLLQCCIYHFVEQIQENKIKCTLLIVIVFFKHCFSFTLFANKAHVNCQNLSAVQRNETKQAIKQSSFVFSWLHATFFYHSRHCSLMFTPKASTEYVF